MSDPKRRKILVIEDEKDLVKLLKYNLEKDGYTVLTAFDGGAGLTLYQKEQPHLVILDLMLPKMDGLEVCRAIRREGNRPIIMLTAKREEADRVVGLELGADDYVTKPFSVRELLARVKARLRSLETPPVEEGIIRLRTLSIDLERFEVRVADKEIALSSREFQFLKLLAQAHGRVLSRDQLLEAVWGVDNASEIDSRTVDQHVARLRKKLGPEGHRVVTVKNAGYKLQWNS